MSEPLLVRAVPLTAEAYAPYGEVIQARPGARPANQGTAARSDFLTDLANLRPGGARLNVAVFRCAPRAAWPFEIALLERHPASAQAFVPMNARRYLVVVCGGDEAPVFERLGVFVADGRQGISYRPGVWHHPMIALDAETDFACLVWEDGTAGDCEVRARPFANDLRCALVQP